MDETSQNKAINTLRKIPVFSGLQGDEYQQLLSICSVSHYRSGDTIFQENDPSTAMYILLSGEAEMQTGAGGCMFIMKPGDLFGEIGVISQIQRTASAVVSKDAALLELGKDKFDFLLGKNPLVMAKILRNVAKVLAERLVSSSSHRYIL
jgi:CRP-like cAMP-binding protein